MPHNFEDHFGDNNGSDGPDNPWGSNRFEGIGPGWGRQPANAAQQLERWLDEHPGRAWAVRQQFRDRPDSCGFAVYHPRPVVPSLDERQYETRKLTRSAHETWHEGLAQNELLQVLHDCRPAVWHQYNLRAVQLDQLKKLDELKGPGDHEAAFLAGLQGHYLDWPLDSQESPINPEESFSTLTRGGLLKVVGWINTLHPLEDGNRPVARIEDVLRSAPRELFKLADGFTSFTPVDQADLDRQAAATRQGHLWLASPTPTPECMSVTVFYKKLDHAPLTQAIFHSATITP